MGQHNIFNKVELAAFLKESGIPLIDFQKPNNRFYIFQHHKSREYLIVEFHPREDELKPAWKNCFQLSLPAWMKSYDDFAKSKRIRMRSIDWEKHPHDGCYFESYESSWVTIN